ncbi:MULTISPECIES: hypothetical protein [unclassified Helicobacter]|uniref:hypothetical protein n=1 Tax=unclassified Helicobacter TaxID=2593540 RepID=UPI0012E8BDDF|nr:MULTISPECIES: hypothetical protein [unclassified Helicobacter]
MRRQSATGFWILNLDSGALACVLDSGVLDFACVCLVILLDFETFVCAINKF